MYHDKVYASWAKFNLQKQNKILETSFQCISHRNVAFKSFRICLHLSLIWNTHTIHITVWGLAYIFQGWVHYHPSRNTVACRPAWLCGAKSFASWPTDCRERLWAWNGLLKPPFLQKATAPNPSNLIKSSTPWWLCIKQMSPMGAALIQTTTLAEGRSNLAGCFITAEYTSNICQLAYSKIILHQETLWQDNICSNANWSLIQIRCI